jgi:hypothetical protein
MDFVPRLPPIVVVRMAKENWSWAIDAAGRHARQPRPPGWLQHSQARPAAARGLNRRRRSFRLTANGHAFGERLQGTGGRSRGEACGP